MCIPSLLCRFCFLKTCLAVLARFTWRHHQNNLGTAILVGNVTVHYSVKCAFWVTRIELFYGAMAFTRKPIDHQNGECVTVTACDVRVRGQYSRDCLALNGTVLLLNYCTTCSCHHQEIGSKLWMQARLNDSLLIRISWPSNLEKL